MQEFVTASVKWCRCKKNFWVKKKLLKNTVKPDKSMCYIVRTSAEMFSGILDAPTALSLPVVARFVSFWSKNNVQRPWNRQVSISCKFRCWSFIQWYIDRDPTNTGIRGMRGTARVPKTTLFHVQIRLESDRSRFSKISRKKKFFFSHRHYLTLLWKKCSRLLHFCELSK